MKNRYPFLSVMASLIFVVLFSSQIQAQSQISINPNQITEITESNPEVLFDGDTKTYWSAGWDQDDYPASAYVDLEGSYQLEKIELYDFTGVGNFQVFTGSPGNWSNNPIVEDDLKKYKSWETHATNATTTHLLFVINSFSSNVGEVRIFGSEDGGTTGGGNNEIVFDPVNDVTMDEGTSETILFKANNAENIWASDLAGFMTFSDLGNGNGRLVINPGSNDAGFYQISVSANNESGVLVTQNLNVTVQDQSGTEPNTGGGEVLCEILSTQLILGEGDPGMLVDEQNAINDPANGPGGNPSTFWFPGWKSRYYPAEGYLDLGSTQTLTRIFLRDINGTGNFKIYAGAPGNWNSTPIVDDNLQAYLSWTEHTAEVTTRYLKVVMADASSKVSEMAVYGYCGEDTGGGSDNIAPAQITNLSTSNITSQSIRLNWQSSGDDGNSGTAASYDLRYSTSPINGGNFTSATAIATGTPQSAGSNETKNVTGLSCNTTYYFAIRATDEAGNTALLSNIVNKKTQSCITQSGKQITLTFNQSVGSVNVAKSKLKYNKDFAYSFTVDDGNIWDYYIAFPLINGGQSGFPPTNPETPWFDFPEDPIIQEAGFKYSDGCGNEVKFKAGLSLNTKHASDEVTNYHITWDNIREMYNSDWDIFSHGHNHCNGGCNYNQEIQTNQDLLEDNIGFLPTHFVVPSGNTNYYDPAYDNGMVAVYDQGYQLPGRNGLQVDDALDYNEFIMHRHSLETASTPYGKDIDLVAGKSGNGNHYWINEFSHIIGHPHGGEYHIRVEYNDFKSYLNYIENTYGKPWSNKKVWMAPMQEVYEYLRVRDAVDISSNQNGNTLTIFVDDDNVPSGLRRHALSLIVTLPNGVSITDVVPNDITIESYNPTSGLLNLKWD